MENIVVYVHGVPCGQSVWGPSDDQDFIKTFYTNKAQSNLFTLFKIDILRNKTFYTYIKQGNVLDVNGRPGAYFAITVSFDASYFISTSLLYTIFQAVFNQLCLDRLIVTKGDNLQYLVNNFEDGSITDCLNNIKTALEQQFSKNLDKINRLPANCNYEKNIAKFNVEDVDSPYFFNCLFKKHIIVSPEFTPFAASLKPYMDKCQILEDELQKRIDELTRIQQQNSLLNEGNKSLANEKLSIESEFDIFRKESEDKEKSLNNNINLLSSQKKELEIELNNLRTDVKELKNNLKKAKSNVEIDQSVSEIKEPLKILARLLASRFPDSDNQIIESDIQTHKENISTIKKTHKKNYKFIIHIVNTCLLIACLVIDCLVVKNSNVNDSSSTESQILNEQLEQEKGSINSYQNQIDSLTHKCNQFEEIMGSIYKIDIASFSKNAIPGKTYTLSLKPELKSNEGEFVVFGDATIKSTNQLVVNSSVTNSEIAIQYVIDDIVISSREINVKK